VRAVLHIAGLFWCRRGYGDLARLPSRGGQSPGSFQSCVGDTAEVHRVSLENVLRSAGSFPVDRPEIMHPGLRSSLDNARAILDEGG